MDSALSPPAFPAGLRHTLAHRISAAELAPVAALLGTADPALSSRAAATLMTRLLVTRFPGPGTRLLREDFRYAAHLAEGDPVELAVEVVGPAATDVVGPATTNVVGPAATAVVGPAATVVVGPAATGGAGPALLLRCSVRRADGTPVLEGIAEVIPPETPPAPPGDLPFGIRPRRMLGLLLDRCRALPPLPVAVVHPCDAASLEGAALAARHGLVEPILVGPEARIRAAAAAAGVDIAAWQLIPAPHSHASAEAAVALVAQGRAAGLVKGSLHTDELMSAALAREAGLRTERRVSHAFVMDAPLYPRLLVITDAAVNIAPDLDAKADIVRNAIRLAVAIGVELPRVALLSAVETVTPRMASTIDAAALCKMADRGQIAGGVLDGPLAFDNAVSEAAARMKGIVSAVAGRADVLVVPDIESGNMLAKQLALLGGAEAAGIVLGLRVPMALTSRSDDAMARLASAALLRLTA